MPTRAPIHDARLSRREALLFEAGVKLGGVFHQYLGMPISSGTAAGVARTIERAVALQPYVVAVRVTIDPARGGPLGRGRFAYRYLTAEMLDVRVRLRDGTEEVEARLAHRPDLRYPLMRVVRVGPGPGRKVTRSARRPARR
ncbi:MAG TPA: dihydroneopterin aldolase family protein [Thermoplasmata archaeon]|nr:dihydroneopterin aldolase family protein [Thermoplasmata archaeon]